VTGPTPRVLITGAGGAIGTALREGLPARGFALRSHDRTPIEPAPDEEMVTGDVTDLDALTSAMAGVDAVVHLAAIATEASYDEIAATNIGGTYAAFEAARRAGVRRVVYASSNHAVGFYPRMPLAPADLRPRPDTYYGVSKVFGEALGSLYADRYGLQVACLRIGSFLPRPQRRRHLSTWLSPGDMVRLTQACLSTPDLGFAVVWGISANTRGWWDLEPGRALGYFPVDDAETYAEQVLAGAPPYHGADRAEPTDPADPTEAFVGGEFAGADYDAP